MPLNELMHAFFGLRPRNFNVVLNDAARSATAQKTYVIFRRVLNVAMFECHLNLLLWGVRVHKPQFPFERKEKGDKVSILCIIEALNGLHATVGHSLMGGHRNVDGRRVGGHIGTE